MRSTARAIGDRLTDDATALRLTLLVLLLRPPTEGAVRGLTWLVAGLALAFPALTRSAVAWLALAALVFARLILDWPLSDNHIYLLAYWCLGIGLCLIVSSPFAAIASMSRWLVGGAFLCVVLWKGILAPDFLDARFFRMTLITDDRFADLSRAIGGLSIGFREDLTLLLIHDGVNLHSMLTLSRGRHALSLLYVDMRDWGASWSVSFGGPGK